MSEIYQHSGSSRDKKPAKKEQQWMSKKWSRYKNGKFVYDGDIKKEEESSS